MRFELALRFLRRFYKFFKLKYVYYCFDLYPLDFLPLARL